MTKVNTIKKRVKGGVIARSAKTGRFISVQTGAKSSRSSKTTTKVLEVTAKRRYAALKRLANR